MISKREVDSSNSLLLTSKDRVDDFSTMTDDHHNTMLLKRGKRVAWFSAAVSEETLTAFLELMKACERRCGRGQCKRNQN